MVHEMIDGTYRQTNLPNESPEYLAKREELRLAEIELIKQRERCAELGVSIEKFLNDPMTKPQGGEAAAASKVSQ